MFLNISNFCVATADIWQTVGYFIMIFKIVIPILLIVLGMFDLGKAVISAKGDEIKKSTGAFFRRAIAGILIFFIPTIITVIFDLVTDDKTWYACKSCLINPVDEECVSYMEVLKAEE